MRIVQLANFYGPQSGGTRTTLDALGRGYAAAGHERVLVVPGTRASCERDATGLRCSLPGLPVSGGYRIALPTPALHRLLDRLAPDALEVSDKLTLVGAAAWARKRGVRSVLLSHERLDAILAPWLPAWVPLRPAADAWNRRLVRLFDAVVSLSAFSCAEFVRIGAPVLHRVPLGVDLDVFSPSAAAPGAPDGVRLVYVGRLSREKQPHLPIETLRVLRERGLPARLDVLGDGPERHRLERRAAGLPARFHGYLSDRRSVAALTAAADVALAPCPAESFGLAALESLACGTPVVTADRGAARELLAPGAGTAVHPEAEAMADGVQHVLTHPKPARRAAARARAEEFPWARAVARMLAVHGA
ncbi:MULTISPECIES: glycosyltransferase [Streptomyces]|uniref:Glycosyltransferase family 1 protein n=1 Tax=Streptomyces luteosporeus TaxID=173856 RepID=A0ABN3TM78_9ACTN